MPSSRSNSVPPRVDGVGLSFKPSFHQAVSELNEPNLWFEVHTENYCAVGGPRRHMLSQLAERFPISLHGVGGSLGNKSHDLGYHLKLVKALVQEINPVLISEHVAWSVRNHEYFADLLPVRRTHEAMNILIDNIDCYQNAVGRPILVENPTHYVELSHDVAEPEFLLEVAKRSGCGLLIDITNLHLSDVNCGISATDFIEQIPPHVVGEIHVAGFDEDPSLHGRLIDSHSQPIPDSVTNLLRNAYEAWGAKPTLIERDANLPEFSELLLEYKQLRAIREEYTHDIA